MTQVFHPKWLQEQTGRTQHLAQDPSLLVGSKDGWEGTSEGAASTAFSNTVKPGRLAHRVR